MGGGDLNSKKSWHPNTMKNQERVWKAEQAVAEEKKRMVELQRERAEERDRSELNSLMKHNSSSSANNNRLAWMYDKPDKKVDQEAFLLGKSIDKNAERSDKVEQDVIPAVSRRVVGSSMLTAAGDAQVDMSRKIREDPLLLIKERERAARAALLNNPLQRRRLAELLRKEQDVRKESKSKKTPKKKDKNLDDLLAAKLSALGGQKSIDLATLLNSDDSSSDSDEDERKHTKQKKKKAKHRKDKKKKKKRKHSSDSDSDDEQSKYKEKKVRYDDSKSSKVSLESHGESKSRKRNSSENGNYSDTDYKTKKKVRHDDSKSSKISSESHAEGKSRKRNSSENGSYSDTDHKTKKNKKDTPERQAPIREYETDYKRPRYYDKNNDSTGHSAERRYRTDDDRERRRNKEVDQRENRKRGGMSEEEKAARLAEMAGAGASREVERGRRVAEQRAAEQRGAEQAPPRRAAADPARCLPDSLESRIHSNRHYIQRDKRHMNEHFARR